MDETETRLIPEPTSEESVPEDEPELTILPDDEETGEPDDAPDPDDDAPESDPSEGERFRRQAEEDLARLRRLDPETASYSHLGEMPGAIRFAELRELGLSVEEAYYAVHGANGEKPTPDRGGRAHLHASVPGRAASGGVGMTVGEIEAARRLFPGLPDREIASLYRRVNENR